MQISASLVLLAIGLVAAAPTAVVPVAGMAMGRPDGTVPAIAPKLKTETLTMENPSFAPAS